MRDIILALFIFGMLPFILVRPYLGLLIWSWLGYMSPNRLCFGFAINFPWVQLVAVVTLLGLLFSKERKTLPAVATSALLVIFLLWTTITSFYAVVPVSAWAKWQEFAKVVVMVFVTLVLVNNRQRMHWLAWMIVVSLGFYGVKGGVFTVIQGGVNHVFGPALSFIADNNALALALCMIIPLMRYLQLHSTRKSVRIGLIAAMLFTGIAVLGTYSRGGLIALLVVSGALFFKGRGRFAVALIVIAVGFIAYQFMPPQWTARMGTLHDATQTDSGETRIQSYKFAVNVALHSPVLGGGFNVYQSDAMWQRFGPEGAIPRAIHSIYFRALGEQGFPGLMLFLALLIVSWRSCSRVRRLTRHDPAEKWAFDLASMLQVSLVAFMAAGTFLPMTYFDLAYQVMALCAVLNLHVRQHASEPAKATHRGNARLRLHLPATPGGVGVTS